MTMKPLDVVVSQLLPDMHCNVFRLIGDCLALFFIATSGFPLITAYGYDEANLVHIQSFEGRIGPGNFTYYRLTMEGFVLIRLESIEGDADLYVSSSSLKPTWEAYDMKSTTCGRDEIAIEPKHERPIGIGVYGYVTDVNIFQMSVYEDPSYQDPYPEMENSDRYKILSGERLPPVSPGRKILDGPKDQEESILWTIFIGFIKILVDVLV